MPPYNSSQHPPRTRHHLHRQTINCDVKIQTYDKMDNICVHCVSVFWVSFVFFCVSILSLVITSFVASTSATGCLARHLSPK